MFFWETGKLTMAWVWPWSHLYPEFGYFLSAPLPSLQLTISHIDHCIAPVTGHSASPLCLILGERKAPRGRQGLAWHSLLACGVLLSSINASQNPSRQMKTKTSPLCNHVWPEMTSTMSRPQNWLMSLPFWLIRVTTTCLPITLLASLCSSCPQDKIYSEIWPQIPPHFLTTSNPGQTALPWTFSVIT